MVAKKQKRHEEEEGEEEDEEEEEEEEEAGRQAMGFRCHLQASLLRQSAHGQRKTEIKKIIFFLPISFFSVYYDYYY